MTAGLATIQRPRKRANKGYLKFLGDRRKEATLELSGDLDEDLDVHDDKLATGLTRDVDFLQLHRGARAPSVDYFQRKPRVGSTRRRKTSTTSSTGATSRSSGSRATGAATSTRNKSTRTG
jgi:hypothetical protein